MSGKPFDLAGVVRNRIVERRMMKPDDLLDHPYQWRVHSQAQAEALAGVLRQVGIADSIKAWRSERAGGRLVSWDGHRRKTLDPDLEWPVDILDVTDEEADLLLATFDPIAAMATADAAMLDTLMREINSDEAGVQSMLADLAAKAGLLPVDVMAEWEGMPEFTPENDFGAVKSITVHFPTWEDYDCFVALIEQPLSHETRTAWFPPKERVKRMDMAFIDEAHA